MVGDGWVVGVQTDFSDRLFPDRSTVIVNDAVVGVGVLDERISQWVTPDSLTGSSCPLDICQGNNCSS